MHVVRLKNDIGKYRMRSHVIFILYFTLNYIEQFFSTGTMFSPLLFIIYVNDIGWTTLHTVVVMMRFIALCYPIIYLSLVGD